MNSAMNIFWNTSENRTRAFWRLILQFLIYIILTIVLLVSMKWILVTIGIIASYQIEPYENIIDASGIIISVWLAARILDKRSFINVGLQISKDWWIDFRFGLFLGGLLITLIFVVEFSFGWVIVTGTFVSEGTNTLFALGMIHSIVLFLALAFAEELFFRGYQITNVTEGLTSRSIGPKWAANWAVVISSSLFALLHANNPHASFISTTSAFMGGTILSLGFVVTKQLAIPIGFHFSWNFFQGSIFGYVVSGEQISKATFIAVEQGGPALWVGNEFGPESGLLAFLAIGLGIVMTTLWVKSRRRNVELTFLR